MQTIYSQIEAISAPIVQHYHADIYRHDRHILDRFDTGDSAVWGPYECGSHIALIDTPNRSRNLTIAERKSLARRDRDLFRAQVSVFGRQIQQWYLLVSEGGQVGTVKPITVERAEELYAQAIGALESSRT